MKGCNVARVDFVEGERTEVRYVCDGAYRSGPKMRGVKSVSIGGDAHGVTLSRGGVGFPVTTRNKCKRSGSTLHCTVKR